jgi:protoporphyrin/coproporphyrin ferrochelatase
MATPSKPQSTSSQPASSSAASSSSAPPQPFDAVLIISFGGPQGLHEIRPFLQNVLRGRRVPPERVEQVAHHYELFGGVSPLTDLTERQAVALAARLEARHLSLPIYIGMRNWRPLLGDTLRAMRNDGVTRAIGLIAAAHHSYSSCTQYRHNVLEARSTAAREAGAFDATPDIVYAGGWHLHDGFIEATADRIDVARATLSPTVRDRARIIFTAHSIPTSMAHAETYQQQLRESAAAVAARLNTKDWALVYQSRSGRPQDPWLEPDVNDYLRAARDEGVTSVIISPLGFVCDHIEVLYDLDVEAKATCEELGLAMARAVAVNDHPRFIDALADAIAATIDRYRTGRPLPIVSADTPNALELPPPVTRV